MVETLLRQPAQLQGARLDTIETPALVLDLAKVDRNIARLKRRLAGLGVAFRPHVKTAKSIDVARRLFPEGHGPITVSTLAEADYFAAAGMTDITYAVGLAPEKIARTRALAAQGVDLAVLIDSTEQAHALTEAAQDGGPMPAVLIEIDCDGHRGGVLPDDTAILEIADILRMGGVELRGVLTHAGESYACRAGIGLSEAAEGERAAAVAAAELLRRKAHAAPVVSAVLATVIGHRAQKGRILIDAGWMALSRDRGTQRHPVDQGYGLVCDMDGILWPDLVVDDASQEHGIIKVRPGSGAPLPDLPIGSRVRILPNHACATGAQHEVYQVLESRSRVIAATWPRMRGW